MIGTIISIIVDLVLLHLVFSCTYLFTCSSV